jgi:DNA-binding response OmpR family regulator
LKLSPREYDLLSRLASNKGMVLSKKTLMEEVFPEHGTDTRFLDVYIDRLRKQLEEDPDKPTIIVNEGEAGYKLVD